MTVKKIKITENIEVKEKHIKALKKERKALDLAGSSLRDHIQKIEKKARLTHKDTMNLSSLNSKLVINSKKIVKNSDALLKQEKAVAKANDQIKSFNSSTVGLAKSTGKAAAGVDSLSKKIKSLGSESSRTAPKKTSKDSSDSFLRGLTGAGVLAALSAVIPPQFKIPLLAAAGLTGAGAGAYSLSSDYVEKSKTAKTYGMTAEEFLQLEKVANRLNLTAENFADLSEELRNKKGEKDNKTYKEALRKLKINPKEFENKRPYEQLTLLFKKLVAVKDIDKRASLSDQITGNQGNRIATGLNDDDILKLLKIGSDKSQSKADNDLIDFFSAINDLSINLKKFVGEFTAKSVSNNSDQKDIVTALNKIDNKLNSFSKGASKGNSGSSESVDAVKAIEKEFSKSMESFNKNISILAHEVKKNSLSNNNNLNKGAY